MTFVNPIGAGLVPARIDMGVDYTGSGDLHAMGNGTIVNVTNSGWPGGTFIALKLDDTGQIIYYAEHIIPKVSVGQKVKAGDVVGHAPGGFPFTEIGWAEPPGSGNTMAAAAGQQSHSGDPGAKSTAYGVAMSNLIQSLGGPPGIITPGGISGTVPSSFGSASPGTVTGASGLGSILGIPDQITGFFSKANDFVTAVMWITKPENWLRVGAFFAGILLLAFAVYALINANSDEPLVSMPKVVPVPV